MDQAFLYKWTEESTRKWYIGSRTAKNCHINDGYICSSKIVKPLITENKDNWYRKILCIGKSKYIRILEGKYLKLLNAKNDKRSFNLNNANDKFDNFSVQDKIRINKDNINKFINKEELDLYRSNGWKKGMSDYSKKIMIKNHANFSGQNNPMYGSSRKGESSSFYGKKHSKKTIEKMKKPKSEEHKKKLSIAKQGTNNPMYGKKQSIETCKKRSESLKGRIPWNKGIKDRKLSLLRVN